MIFGWLKNRQIKEHKKLVFQNVLSSRYLLALFGENQQIEEVQKIREFQRQNDRVANTFSGVNPLPFEDVSALLDINSELRKIDHFVFGNASHFDQTYQPANGWKQFLTSSATEHHNADSTEGLGRHKEASPSLAVQILAMPPLNFAEFVRVTFERDIPATRTMAIVAYANIRPLLTAAADVSKERGDKPFDVNDLIKMTLEKSEVAADEISKRRFLWFFLGALVHRLDQLAEDQAVIDAAVEVWLLLADAGQYLANLLEHNVVWAADEKEYFSAIETKKDGVWYVLKILLPKQYYSHPKIAAFAKASGIF
jgi:hypothetical protein